LLTLSRRGSESGGLVRSHDQFPIPITTDRGEPALLHFGADDLGVDDCGVELEVITVIQRDQEYAIHAMPACDRHTPKPWRIA